MADARQPVIVLGIDEAGYGPILGPLVVSAAAFSVPRSSAGNCLWGVLSESISPGGASKDSRVVIQDSKKLFHRSAGLGRMERSVLAMIGAWRNCPATTVDLLALLCPDASIAVNEYAWYQADDVTLPRAADDGSIRIACAALARNFQAKNVEPAGMWSEVLLEGQFNRLVQMTRNKATTLFGLVLRLIQRAADAYPGRNMLIHVDRQGGRSHYAPPLMRAFENRQMRIVTETEDESEYELSDSRSLWRIRFSQSGECKHMPVALASMMSKYLRELMMERFNAFWRRFAADLAPTAGYYEDGLRFLKEIEPHARRLGIRQEKLIRQR